MNEEETTTEKEHANRGKSRDITLPKFGLGVEPVFEEEKRITKELIDEIEGLRREMGVNVRTYIKEHYNKEALDELTMEEGEELMKALKAYGEKKGIKRIYKEGKQYRITALEDGFFEVKKDDGTVYTTNPHEGLCDCPDMRFRSKERCKHIDLILEAFPEVKEEIEEREKLRSEVTEKKPALIEFTPIDRWDSREVMARLTDEVIRKYYVYEFEREGKTLTGVTADCATDLAHWIGGIEEVDSHVMETKDKYMAKVTVRDNTRDFTVSGVAEAEKWFSGGRPNRHAAKIAYRKAQRNALRRLIPKQIEEIIIQRYKDLKSKEGGS